MAKLNREEQKILASFERGEWKSVKNMRPDIRRYQSYAKATLQKTSRVNIRISPEDLGGIQRRALEEGIPYQTLMASVIHKYLSGRLVEKRPGAQR